MENLYTLDISSVICLLLAFLDWLEVFSCDGRRKKTGQSQESVEQVLLSAEWIQHLMLVLRLDGNDATRPGRSAGFRSADFITAATKIIALFWEDIQ